jgi:hypothetical protein
VTALVTAAGLSASKLDVTVKYPSGNSTGSPVNVTAAYHYSPMITFLPLTSTLRSTTEGMICY